MGAIFVIVLVVAVVLAVLASLSYLVNSVLISEVFSVFSIFEQNVTGSSYVFNILVWIVVIAFQIVAIRSLIKVVKR